MDHGHTMIGRAHTDLDDWMEHEQLKGVFNQVGVMWALHPSWGSDPGSPSYAQNRWSWHQNLGELLNFHSSVHVKNQNVNGVVKKRLAVTLTHPDVARLAAIKDVAGGNIELSAPGTRSPRLRIFDRGAFQVIKCGRLFLPPENLPLFEVINTASTFYSWVPDPGETATDPQLAHQEEEELHLIALINHYRTLPQLQHDCKRAEVASGGGPLTTEKRPI